MQFMLIVWIYKDEEDNTISILTCHGCIHDQQRDCSRSRRGHCTSPPLTPAKSPHRAFSSGEFVPRSFAFAHWPFNFNQKWKFSLDFISLFRHFTTTRLSIDISVDCIYTTFIFFCNRKKNPWLQMRNSFYIRFIAFALDLINRKKKRKTKFVYKKIGVFFFLIMR